MATLQKIRSKGKLLVIVLGLALFAFIAEEFVRSLTYTQSESRQRIGTVYGDHISQQDFNKMVEEYTDVMKFTNGITSLTDEQTSMLRDQVWQTYVSSKLIEHECEKLGLTVTDAEMQNIINNGRNMMLSQTPFRNQKGEFDANQLKQFLSQYDEVMSNIEIGNEVKEQYTQMYNYWKFVEKTIRQQTLGQKYQALLAGTIKSNPISAKDNFEGRINESTILMAALPYSSIKDDEVEVTDADLKAKYAELKEMFSTTQETRDIKYIDVEVTASKSDVEALNTEMQGYAEALAQGADAAKTVREASSLIPYSQLPIGTKALPRDIATEIDSMAVGTQKGPYTNIQDNTMNIIRLISKVTRPDSVEIRQIAAPGTDLASAELTADSIMQALNAGTAFDSIAKKYDQPGAKTWLTSAQYEGMTMDENNRKFIETVTTAPVGQYNKIVLDGQGVIIVQVTDQRAMTAKYDLAVIKRKIDFSKDTYGKAYNDFSSFIAGNRKSEDMEANAAKEGYTMQTRTAISSTEHYVANVHSTRDALRWIFDEDTKVGDVSPLYECGDNDHLMVIILTGVHKKGYLAWDDEQVKTYLTTEVQKDKKAAMLQEKMKDAKSIADVQKIAGAQTDTINHINFTNNAFVTKVGRSEPALSGAVATTKKGDFKAGVKGNGAIYAFQVIDQTKIDGAYDKKTEEGQAMQSMLRGLSAFTSELYQKAKVVDNRYLFY
ncbi:MAG: peptidylprolyl isomerase [Bacteroidaceae bacterium]